MTGQALSVIGVTAGYVPGMPVIRNISLTTKPQEIVCIVGPNGAGKSTLLKAIAGLLEVDEGSIKLGDRCITSIRTDKLKQSGVALVPQLNNTFRTMSVEQNLVLAVRRYEGNRQQRITDMLEMFPVLAEKYKAKAGSLSGGQRQFLAVAMALIAQPSLLLLDEPSAGLSPKAVADVLGMLRDIAQGGVSILMVEQNVKAALTISDRAYVFADGRNQHEAAAQTLLNDPILGAIYLGTSREEAYAAKPV